MSRTLLQPLQVLLDIDTKCRRWAQPHQATANGQPLFLSFLIQHQRYLLHQTWIEEILRFDSYTKVSAIPGARPWHYGLTSVRGQLVNIIDLQAYLSEKTTEIGQKTRIIIVRRKQFMSGLLVPEVNGLISADAADSSGKIERLPMAHRQLTGTSYLLDGRTHLLLDLDQLFNDPEFSQAAIS